MQQEHDFVKNLIPHTKLKVQKRQQEYCRLVIINHAVFAMRSLLARYDEAGKFFQARSWTNAATCAKSKDKKCQILNGYGSRHRDRVAKRNVCQPKHEGEYKRMLHRVLQSEAGNTICLPAQAGSSSFGTRLMTDFWETWIWKQTFPVWMLYCLHQHMLVL